MKHYKSLTRVESLFLVLTCMCINYTREFDSNLSSQILLCEELKFFTQENLTRFCLKLSHFNRHSFLSSFIDFNFILLSIMPKITFVFGAPKPVSPVVLVNNSLLCVSAQRGKATISHFWFSPPLNYNRCSLAMEMNGRRRAESWLDKYV